MSNLQLQLQVQELLKLLKGRTELDVLNTLGKVSNLSIQMNEPHLSVEQDLLINDPSKSIVGATCAKISNDIPDPDVANSLVEGTDVYHGSECSQLVRFMHDLEESPYHLQQAFLNQLISRSVLRLESHNNPDWLIYALQQVLGDSVHQSIYHWLDRLDGAVYRVSLQPLHPLLSTFSRQDLAQRTVELLQRELDNIEPSNDIRYQQAPIPSRKIQLTDEQEQQLWDLAIGINPSVSKRALGASISQKEVDGIIKKARQYPSWPPRFYEIDTCQVCSDIFRDLKKGLIPEKLSDLATFLGTTLKQFPILSSTEDNAIAESLYLLWCSSDSDRHYDETHLEIAQKLSKVLPDRLQHARSRETTVVVFLGLRAVAHILNDRPNRPLALNPYVAFCRLMRGSLLPDRKATLDRMCSSMLAELRQLKDVNLERFAISQMGKVEADGGMSLPRSYCQYRLANPPVAHEEAMRHLATTMTEDCWQALQALHTTDSGLEERQQRHAAQT